MQTTRRNLLGGMGAGAATLLLPAWAKTTIPHQANAPRANVTGGPIAGYRSGPAMQIAAFKGIPYGMDTARTRFQAPLPVAPWAEVRHCTEWAPRAPQQSADRARNSVAAGFNAIQDAPVHYHLPEDEGTQSEDCLHLNVWTPALGAPSRKLPVLVYIHGGAYTNGTVNAALYDGTRLALHGAVVVTVNHRLNSFGYMYLAGLRGLAERYRDSGNAGMLDLVLALEWVRDNIARFGGDPGRVTIFGQSGGGAKCATLMAMPAAQGLFHRVWTMSGQQVWAAPPRLATERSVAALAAIGLTGDITAEKLDALTMEQIQKGSRTTPNWLPVKDGGALPRDPFDPDAPSISASVPMILGNTKDEVTGGAAWRYADLTWEKLPDELGSALAPFRGKYTPEQIIAAYRGWYPAYKPVDVYVAAIAAFRSWPGQVIEAERRVSNAESAARTWVYQIDFPSPTANGRAPHTVDIAFVFDNLKLSPGMVGDSPEDLRRAQPLANLMSGMLLQFARSGDPNGPGLLPRWPVYDLQNRRTMIFDLKSRVESDPRGQERRMMVGAHYRQPGT